LRILVAEDEPVQLRLLQGLLTGWGHDVVLATDGDRAWSILTGENPPNLAILDWMMPAMDGLRICKELRQSTAEGYTYILVVTARDQKNDLVEALEAGADDYLTKPFDIHELKARLHAGKRVLDLEEKLRSANLSLQFQATHDTLTGLLNRGAVLDALLNEFARSRRERKSVGVILADIDHFKTVNDTHGHAAGDAVLREVAQSMRSVIRTYDSLGRYGGEEFLAVLPGCDTSVATQRAEQMRQSVASIKVAGVENLAPTLSLGVVSVCAQTDYEQVLAAADAALYLAKKGGRNRVETGAIETLPGKPARHR
jgi:diguanylate cyclase (GGDEF)-like protein